MTGVGASLDALAAALEARDDDPRPALERTEDGLLVALHPGAEPIALRARDGRVHLVANTATAGPGYHRHVVAVAEALDVRWDPGGDELTGWRARRDPAALEEPFLDWLGATAAQILALADEGASGFALAMPAGVAYEHDELVATQLGPRSRAWLEAVRSDPRAGIDVFPWWAPERGAAYFRDLAMLDMWRSIRWRAPLTDEERAAMERVATWIEKAHGLDPSIELPWAEQSELLTCLDEASLRATRAHLKAQRLGAPAIGYRRRAVRVELSGGWSLTVPGELAERWDERGTWVAWDAQRSVFFSSFTAQGEGAASASTEATLDGMPPLDGDELLELERGELRGLAALSEVEEDGMPLYRLEAHAAIGPHAAVGTLVFVDAADREWALETWGSLDRR